MRGILFLLAAVYAKDGLEDSSSSSSSSSDSSSDSDAGGCQDDTSERIVGGAETDTHEFPSIVRVAHNRAGECGGVIIDKNTVLTAAHCCTVKQLPGHPMMYQFLGVYVGAHFDPSCTPYRCSRKASKYNPNDEELKGTFIKVAENGVKVHKRYRGKPRAYLNDYCMLKLAEDIDFTATNSKNGKIKHQPIPIAIARKDTPEAGTCVIAGWGKVEDGGGDGYKPSVMSTFLRKANVEVQSDEECNKSKSKLKSAMYRKFSINKPQITCAGNPDKPQDSCGGDSGGPLYCKSTHDGKRKLFGITSFGAETCGMDAFEKDKEAKAAGRCDEKNVAPPGYYANARAANNWVFEEIASDWTEWTSCQLNAAGQGERTRSRLSDDQNLSSWAGGLETESCEYVKPEWSEWSEWSRCSAPCNGFISRRRKCLAGAVESHDCIGAMEQRSPCNVDCDSLASSYSMTTWCNQNFDTWTDSSGDNCERYAQQHWCNKTGYGPNWRDSWGDFEKYAAQGYTAFNCPQCGCTSWKGAPSN